MPESAVITPYPIACEPGGEDLWNQVPNHLQPGIKRYLDQRIPLGSFLTAVFSNNLVDAVGCASEESLLGLKALCQFMVFACPRASLGSKAAVKAWLEGK